MFLTCLSCEMLMTVIVRGNYSNGQMSLSPDNLKSATDAFNHFFAGNVLNAREAFAKKPHDPYHLLGLATCSFLEAAMSMEVSSCYPHLSPCSPPSRMQTYPMPPPASTHRSNSPLNTAMPLNSHQRADSRLGWNGMSSLQT